MRLIWLITLHRELKTNFSLVLRVFEVEESISDIFTELLCSRDLEHLSQLPVLPPIFALLADTVASVASIFLLFQHSLCFRGRGTRFSQFHKATMFAWSRKSRSTSGFASARGYWWLSLMDFRNFFIPYIFEVEGSIYHSFTKLPCSDDHENPGQLSASQVLDGSDDWVLWIFVISSFPTFLRLRNPFLPVSQSCYVWVTSKNPGQLPVSQVLQGTDDWVLWIFVISLFLTFSRSRYPSLTELPELPLSGDLKNSSQLPVLQVLKDTDDWILCIFVISSFLTFSRSRNPFLANSKSYHVWVISKI